MCHGFAGGAVVQLNPAAPAGNGQHVSRSLPMRAETLSTSMLGAGAFSLSSRIGLRANDGFLLTFLALVWVAALKRLEKQ